MEFYCFIIIILIITYHLSPFYIIVSSIYYHPNCRMDFSSRSSVEGHHAGGT